MVGAAQKRFKNGQWQALIVLQAVFVGAPLEVRTERSEATKGKPFLEARRARKCLIALRINSVLRTVRPSSGTPTAAP